MKPFGETVEIYEDDFIFAISFTYTNGDKSEESKRSGLAFVTRKEVLLCFRFQPKIKASIQIDPCTYVRCI